MRARGCRSRLGWAIGGALCALCLVAAVSAQSGNPLRTSSREAPPATRAEVKAEAEPTPRRRVAPVRAASSSPRRFTDYEIWGDEQFPRSDGSRLVAGENPLRQISYSEELPAPATTSPQQALRETKWNSYGPEGYDPEHPSGLEGGGLFSNGWFVHADPNDPHRSIGLGEPLVGTSWRNRPWYVGAFIGGIFNGDLIFDHVQQNNTALAGLRLGCDFDHYWGAEARFAYSNPHTSTPDDTPIDDSRNYLADVGLLYYPWGDSRWRPYFSLGLGQATFRFTDDQGRVVHESLLSMPLGVGVKYFQSPWMSFRFDFAENFAFGSHVLDNQANFSLMAGVEYRFGGRRPSYFPWHGNTVGW